jgi:hypothetical protein
MLNLGMIGQPVETRLEVGAVKIKFVPKIVEPS